MLAQLQSSNALTILIIMLAGGFAAFLYDRLKTKHPQFTWLRGTFFGVFIATTIFIMDKILGKDNFSFISFILVIIVITIFDLAVFFYDRLMLKRPALARWRILFMLVMVIFVFMLIIIADTAMMILS